MLRDITLGQYYPADSLIHKLDPRVKLISTFAFIISVLFAGSVMQYAVAILFLGIVIGISKVPFRFMVKGLRSVILLLAITVSFNLFVTPGETVVSFWIFKITKEGILLACELVVRLVILIISSSVMTLTTTPNQLTDGLEKIMNPLRKLKVPVHEVAMTISIALRFIPILLEETDKIMKAQTARGADFEEGGFIKKAKSLIPVLVPLFVSAFRRASDLAMAMEARCYRGGSGRTKMKPLIYKRRDIMAYVWVVIYLAVIIGGYQLYRYVLL